MTSEYNFTDNRTIIKRAAGDLVTLTAPQCTNYPNEIYKIQIVRSCFSIDFCMRGIRNPTFDDTGVEIGVISLPPATYYPNYWWSSSQELKTVLTETLAVMYEAIADSGR